MADVSVGLSAIKNAEAVCMGAIQDLNSSADKLNKNYIRAGFDWDDSKYVQLGDIVNDCSRAMKSPIDDLFECVEKLREIEKALIEYESTNL